MSHTDNTTNQPCLKDNEGNVVNINTCCDDKDKNPKNSAPAHYNFYEQPAPVKSCCFDVYMTRVYLTHNKDVFPEGGVIVMGYANEKSATAPGLGTYLNIHPRQGWVNINTKIGSFKVQEGDRFPVYLRLDALEWGQGLDGASDVGSDLENGQERYEKFILDCSYGDIQHTQIAVKLERPGGGDAGRIVVEFAAFRGSCCC